MRGLGVSCSLALACGPSQDIGATHDILVVVDDQLHLGDSVSGELVALGTVEPDAYVASAMWSPDGRHVAISVFADETREIRLIDTVDGVERVLSTRGAYQLTWAPDGHAIAFRMVREVPSAAEDEYELAVVDVGGTATQVLTQTDGVVEWAPNWSPDGRWIAVSTTPTIRLFGPEGTVGPEIDGSAGVLAWSTDASRLAFSGGGAITITDVDEGISSQVGPEDSLGWFAWSSEHDRFVATVMRRETGVPKTACDLVLFGERSGESRVLASSEPGFCLYGLEWSPDGDALLMTVGATRGPNYEDTQDTPPELYVLSESMDSSWTTTFVARSSDWTRGVWACWRPALDAP